MKYQSENFDGSLDFRSRLHHGWQVEAHLHEYSEILYCESGEGAVTVNGREMHLAAGEFIFLTPHTIHQYDFADATLICAVFSNDLVPLFFKALGGRRLLTEALSAGELAPILSRLPAVLQGEYLEMSGYLNVIATHVLRVSRLEDAASSNAVLYQKVITYLSEHYTEDLTLTKLAKRFGYHEKYLSHALHTLTGIHFRQLLAFYRIGHAKRLLEAARAPSITAIAAESGFASQNTFHRAFRAATGMTPLLYRRQFLK